MWLCDNSCDITIPCASPLGITTTTSFTREPAGCKRELCPAPGGACMEDCVLMTAGLNNVRTQFMVAYDKIEAEDFEGAHADFAPVAALWGATATLSSTNICRTFVDAGKSLSEASGYSMPGGEERSQNTNSGSMTIIPNPASGEVTIRLPEGMYTLRIWNTLGKLVSESNISGITLLDVSLWTPGIYLLECAGSGGQRENARLVVQR